MRTFSQYQEDRKRARDDASEKHRQVLEELLRQADTVVKVYESDRENDRTDYADWRMRNREALRNLLSGKWSAREGWMVSIYDFCCDHCGTQLLNLQAGVTLMSYPPQKHVHCLGCGWHGYTTA